MARELSPLGVEFLASIPPRLADDAHVQAVLSCYAQEDERLAGMRDALQAGLASPKNADAAVLPLWERLFGVQVAPSGVSLADRQARAEAYGAQMYAGRLGAAWVLAVDRIVAAIAQFALDGDFESVPVGALGSSAGAWTVGSGFSTKEVVALEPAPSWPKTPGRQLHVVSSATSGAFLTQNTPRLGIVPHVARIRTKVLSQSGAGRVYLLITWNGFDLPTGTTTVGIAATGVGEHVSEVTVTPPVGTFGAKIQVAANDSGSAGTIDAYVDDVELVNIGPWSHTEHPSTGVIDVHLPFSSIAPRFTQAKALISQVTDAHLAPLLNFTGS